MELAIHRLVFLLDFGLELDQVVFQVFDGLEVLVLEAKGLLLPVVLGLDLVGDQALEAFYLVGELDNNVLEVIFGLAGGAI